MSKRLAPSLLTLLLVVGGWALWYNRMSLFDTWRLRDYNAPAEVAKLADVTTMKPDTRRLFYVYQPSLEDRSQFNAHCNNAEQTIVLGCYIERQGIYLYRVSDNRLNGVVEVTAAHELLHAAYDRLSSRERKHVDSMTDRVARSLTDERIKQTIENYRKKDPSVVPNELHSILGTEVRDLPAELEDYYRRYFVNRGAIVTFADAYKQAFTDREQEVKSLDARLAELKQQIDALNGSLETQQVALKARYEALQSLRRSGNVEAYNAAVPGYNALVGAYNVSVNRQKQLVNQYNALVDQRNNLAVEENELIKALDSRDTIDRQ